MSAYTLALGYIRVEVTEEDIAGGRRTATRCPLARAIRRATSVRPVAVFGFGDGWEAGGQKYELSFDAASFVSAFDHGADVQPRAFVFPGPGR